MNNNREVPENMAEKLDILFYNGLLNTQSSCHYLSTREVNELLKREAILAYFIHVVSKMKSLTFQFCS